MGWATARVLVRVPATSANLGPGFDALGLALSLHDEIEVRVTASGLDIEVSGEGAGEVGDAGEKHLLVRSLRAALDDLGAAQPAGLALRCVNRIPHGRGLGSSAAAIVAGVLAARALAGASLAADDALPLADALEGHPDNVAPCLFGGLTIAWTTEAGARAVRLETLPEVRPVAFIAPSPVATEVARGLLPATVPHADAAANAGRAALLVALLTSRPDALLTSRPDALLTSRPDALLTARTDALLYATEDRLHQDYRASAMPATHALVRRLRAAGIPAVVSGAGPTALAFLTGEVLAGDLETLGSIAGETGMPWRIKPLDIERRGASATPGLPSTR
jgi:homoserine kinase